MACKLPAFKGRHTGHSSLSPAVLGCRQAGLTLIELLVAISVLAFVAVLGWRGLDGIVRARIGLSTGMEQTRGMQLAFAQMQNDCAHIAGTDLLPGRTALAAEQGRLIMVRTATSDNQPMRLQVITYRIRDGVLTRRESIATRDLNELNGLWLAAVNDTDQSPAVALQEGVAAMSMRTWSNAATGWQIPGPSSAQAGAPATGTNARMPPGPQGAAAQAGQIAQATPTGLEVALQMQDSNVSMLKIFLLGAV